MSFTPLRQDRTSHEVYRQVRASIIEGKYRPGERLPTERDLMEAFLVSRTTIREAMRMLEQAGLITLRRGPKGGAFILQPGHAKATEAFSLVLSFDPPAAAELLEARIALESNTARLAALRASAGQISRLESTNHAIAGSPGDVDVFMVENWIFHMTIAEAAGNRVLDMMMDSIRELMQQSLNPVPPAPHLIDTWLEAHRGISAAIARHDSEEAERLMVAHLRGIEPRIRLL